jgi:hypothetical protein
MRIAAPCTLQRSQAKALAIALVSLSVLNACSSPESYVAERRERLLELYPVGTPRAQVQAKFDPIEPDFSEVRPAAGWIGVERMQIGARALASKQRTGKSPYRVERYLAPDGLFSLCLVWFYYDENDQFVDAEWQWHTD